MTEPIPSSKNGKFQCPECDKVYDAANSLGRHRQAAHGVAGSSSASVAKRKERQAQEKKAAERAASRPAVKRPGPGRPRGIHTKIKNKALVVSTPPMNHPRNQDLSRGTPAKNYVQAITEVAEPAISTNMVAYAAGKLESMAEQIAQENGLPVREFVVRAVSCLAVIVKA
jgi:uncharacterized C2H2 Zn-finger protein